VDFGVKNTSALSIILFDFHVSDSQSCIRVSLTSLVVTSTRPPHATKLTGKAQRRQNRSVQKYFCLLI
jgi:hypothetical protein